MKRPNRVVKNGSANGAAKQAHTKLEKEIERREAAPPPVAVAEADSWDPNGAALVLMTGSEDGPEREIAGWNYSAAEFASIQQLAANSKETLAEFLKSAMDARLNRHRVMEELEQAIDQALALNDLLEERVLTPLEDGGLGGRVKNGIVHLGLETYQRLWAAVAAVENPEPAEGGVR